MAVSLADSNLVTSSATVAANTAANVGDLIFVASQSTTAATGATDSLGNTYTLLSADEVTGNSFDNYVSVLYSVVSAAGTPTVTISPAGVGTGGRLGYVRYTGFVSGATVITADTNFSQGTSPHSVGFAASFTGSKVNEYGFGAFIAQNGQGLSNSSQWSYSQANSYLTLFDTVTASGALPLGTNFNLTGTLGSDVAWGLRLYGFYDASAAGSTTFVRRFGGRHVP